MSKNSTKTANQKATLALKMVKKLTKEVRPEFKYHLNAIATGPSATGTIIHLTDIPQGITAITRVGAEAIIKSLSLKMYMSQNASASNTILRLIIFIDTGTDGTLPTVAEVLGTSPAVVSHKNPGLRRRFTFLKDKLYSFGDVTVRTLEYYRKINMVSEWAAASGLIATASNNHLFMLLISDEPTDVPIVTGDVQLAFTDE